MKKMARKRFYGRAYFLVFPILLSTAFGQFTTQTSIVTLAIGNISQTERPSSASAQASAITNSTPYFETEDLTTGETTDDSNISTDELVTLLMAPTTLMASGITNSPATGTTLPAISGNVNVSEKEIRVFTKIAQNIIRKQLEALEEKIDKLTSKLNGEQLRTSKPVENIAFFAQRNSSFDKKNTIQPYLINRLNDGVAFDQASGIFTAPINGNYHFYFTALKANTEISGTSIITVRLWANKNQKGKIPQMLAEGHVNSNDMHGWFPVTLHATVKLQENDTVEVELYIGSIHESENLEHLLTSFGGFLVSPETK